MNVDQIDFETYLEKKGEFPTPMEPYPEPTITVGDGRTEAIYISSKAVEKMGLIPEDYLAAAPNPDEGNTFFLCPNNNREGYSVSLNQKKSGANVARNLIANLGNEFDREGNYKVESTDMTHPQWGSPIFLARPVDVSTYDHILHK